MLTQQRVYKKGNNMFTKIGSNISSIVYGNKELHTLRTKDISKINPHVSCTHMIDFHTSSHKFINGYMYIHITF